jgi:CDP-diacylglycerol--serine O-phosphatidyltransferase
VTGDDLFRQWQPVMAWTLFIALLMISSIPTYSWSSLRIRSGWRLFALAGVALLGAALIRAPWITLLIVCAVYLLMIPFSLASYARVKRRRASVAARASAA